MSYVFALAQGIIQAIPNTSIEKAANKYPQYIFFRIFDIAGAWFIAIVWVLAYWWINSKSQEALVEIKNTTLIWTLGLVSSIFQMISVATVDTGHMNWSWFYEYSASFVLLMTVTQLYYTYKVYELNGKTPIIEGSSLLRK